MNRVRLAMGWMLLTALALGAAPTRAQQPASQPGGPATMVKDINPGAGEETALGSLAALGEIIFFTASDGAHGLELWKSDGTAAGTLMVADINPAGSGVITNSQLLASGGAIYFAGDDGQHGLELWKSDGTAAGTLMVKDINPGAAGALAEYGWLTPFGGGLILRANDGVHGPELWKSDGTAAGTALIRDINPGTDPNWRFQPSDLTPANGWLYFVMDDGAHGRELWKTDGLSATTTLVKDIRPGADSSDPEDLIYAEGKLHFAAIDSAQLHSKSIWTTDGTVAGTVEGATIPVGPAGDQSIRMMNAGGRLYYVTGNTARFSCTLHGPSLRRDFGSCPYEIVQAYGRVFFVAGEGVNPTKVQLWQTDGTDAGTSLFKEQPLGTYISELTEARGWLFYSGNDGQHGQELWQSAGTPAGTAMIQDINPGAGGSYSYGFTLAGDRLFFTADDGVHGTELWSLPLGPRWANRLFAPLLVR